MASPLDQALSRAFQASGVVPQRKPGSPIGGAIGGATNGGLVPGEYTGAIGGGDPNSPADPNGENATFETPAPGVGVDPSKYPDEMGGYTSPDKVTRMYRMADALRNQPFTGGKLGVLAQVLGAIGGGVYENSANKAASGNDAATLAALRRAGAAGNPSLMARFLLQSNNPQLAQTGLQMLAKGGDAEATSSLRRAQAAEANAKAGYYNRDRSGRDSLEMTRQENLVQRAAMKDPEFDNDPLGTIDKYRQAYREAWANGGGAQPSANPGPVSGAGPAPGAAPAGAAPGGQSGQAASVLNEARAAIAKGKDPAAVKQRLQSMGIDPSGL